MWSEGPNIREGRECNMKDFPIDDVVRKLEEVLSILKAIPGGEVEEDFEVNVDRILPTQDEIDALDDKDVVELLKSFCIEGGEVTGTARVKRQALKALVAELEGDDLEIKWSSSILNAVGKMLGVPAKEAEVLLAIQKRAEDIGNDTMVEPSEEENEEVEETESNDAPSVEKAAWDVGDIVSVTLPSMEDDTPSVYKAKILVAEVGVLNGIKMTQVEVEDEDGEKDVIDVAADSLSAYEEPEEAPAKKSTKKSPKKEKKEAMDYSILFSEKKLSAAVDLVPNYTEADIKDNIENYIEILKSAAQACEEMEGEKDTKVWIATMLDLMSSDEDLSMKAGFYLAAFLPDGSDEPVDDNEPVVVDESLFCNGIPMGEVDDVSEMIAVNDSSRLTANQVVGDTEDMIPCCCYATSTAWVYDTMSDEFVELAFAE